MSLVEQLLDRRDVSMTEFLLQRLGVSGANIIRREPSQSESEVQSCVSCGERRWSELCDRGHAENWNGSLDPVLKLACRGKILRWQHRVRRD